MFAPKYRYLIVAACLLTTGLTAPAAQAGCFTTTVEAYQHPGKATIEMDKFFNLANCKCRTKLEVYLRFASLPSSCGDEFIVVAGQSCFNTTTNDVDTSKCTVLQNWLKVSQVTKLEFPVGTLPTNQIMGNNACASLEQTNGIFVYSKDSSGTITSAHVAQLQIPVDTSAPTAPVKDSAPAPGEEQVTVSFKSAYTASSGDGGSGATQEKDLKGYQILCAKLTGEKGSITGPGLPKAKEAIFQTTANACPSTQTDGGVADVGVDQSTSDSGSTTSSPWPTPRAANCKDKMQNGDETDVDCGGSTCPTCADSKKCKTNTDCTSGLCDTSVTPNVCKAAPSHCSDNTKSGDETDVDCGGSCPTKCADSKGCTKAGDCTSGVCTRSQCAAPSCTDGVKNGTETDVDCGGSCTKCATGKGCAKNADCATGTCDTTATPPVCKGLPGPDAGVDATTSSPDFGSSSGIDSLPLDYICSDKLTTEGSADIRGLSNGVAYRFWAVAVDDLGNASKPVELGDATPQPEEDLWERYKRSGGGAKNEYCFVATAAYGSYDHPHVRVLRDFRDGVLMTNRPGRALVRAYYRHSPGPARWLARHDGLRLSARAALWPVTLAAGAVVYSSTWQRGLTLSGLGLMMMLWGLRARRRGLRARAARGGLS